MSSSIKFGQLFVKDRRNEGSTITNDVRMLRGPWSETTTGVQVSDMNFTNFVAA